MFGGLDTLVRMYDQRPAKRIAVVGLPQTSTCGTDGLNNISASFLLTLHLNREPMLLLVKPG